MHKLTIIAAAALALATTAADAKQWQWRALDTTGGQAKEIATGAECNYQRAISAARKAGAGIAGAALALTGVDNLTACPPAVRKPKVAAAGKPA